jgi:hypothetical protein
MATNLYMTGRKKYSRPQGMLWSENPGKLSSGSYIPDGFEVGAILPPNTNPDLADQFLILSDHNRQPIDFKTTRIEKRERTINGRMRSYHIADKLTISTSWNLLPSRSYSTSPDFNTSGVSSDKGMSGLPYEADMEFTADGGAGGVEMLSWYEDHKGPFWVYLAYDRYDNFSEEDTQRYGKLGQYNQLVEMYISSFDYTVVKRGGSNFDLWNINVTLEEV